MERIVFYPASSSLPQDSWGRKLADFLLFFHSSLHSLVAHRIKVDSRRSCRAPCSLGNISVGKYLSLRQLEKNIESEWRTRQAAENAHYSRNAGKVLGMAVIEPIFPGLGVPCDERTGGASILRWLSKNGLAELSCVSQKSPGWRGPQGSEHRLIQALITCSGPYQLGQLCLARIRGAL